MSARLRALSREITHHRRGNRNKGGSLPNSFKERAVELLAHHDAQDIARSLRVSRELIDRWESRFGRHPSESTSDFFEVAGVEPASSVSGGDVFEIDGGEGRVVCLRGRFDAQTVVTLAELLLPDEEAAF